MTRRERLLATFQGREVDRPAVSFYEIGGWKMDVSDDEFTVWNDPSWRPLVEMASTETDLIRFVSPRWREASDNGLGELTTQESWNETDSHFTRTTIRAGGRPLTSLRRRDKDTQTTWKLEHLLEKIEDVQAYLELPEPTIGHVDISGIIAEEEALGESGIVSIEFSDPLCSAAGLFSMEDYTIMALTQPEIFRRLLDRYARAKLAQCEQLAKACPGRLWRICGSEYASEPYLPPRLYDEYVVRYTGQIIKIIQKHGGYARIHSHGRLRGILPHIARMRPDGLDPLEPPPQGDMELWELREAIGQETVLMGNIEAADIENLPTNEFEKRVVTALREGTSGKGRGFILQPSACPYGRTITAQVMANYETMIRLAKDM
jgi:Uroporphyrinogen decarboxylase (URO-D)